MGENARPLCCGEGFFPDGCAKWNRGKKKPVMGDLSYIGSCRESSTQTPDPKELQ